MAVRSEHSMPAVIPSQYLHLQRFERFWRWIVSTQMRVLLAVHKPRRSRIGAQGSQPRPVWAGRILILAPGVIWAGPRVVHTTRRMWDTHGASPSPPSLASPNVRSAE